MPSKKTLFWVPISRRLQDSRFASAGNTQSETTTATTMTTTTETRILSANDKVMRIASNPKIISQPTLDVWHFWASLVFRLTQLYNIQANPFVHSTSFSIHSVFILQGIFTSFCCCPAETMIKLHGNRKTKYYHLFKRILRIEVTIKNNMPRYHL